MAVPVARVHLAMAHAALPGLLPTPSCAAAAFALPTNYYQSPPLKPGRADAADRWDARKQQRLKNESSSTSSSSCKAGRADAADRWDARKTGITARSSSSGQSFPNDGSWKMKSGRPGRASSCERWDVNKNRATSPSSTSSSSSSSSSGVSNPASRAASTASSSCGRPVVLLTQRSSSAERRDGDAHRKKQKQKQKQKPRPPPLPAADASDGESSTGSNDVEVDDYYDYDDTPRPHLTTGPPRAGPSFLAPPPPSMLPTPSFLVLPRLVTA